MRHPRRHPLIWLALAAMLALVVLPTVSHALARTGVGAGAEVCTPQGLRSVAAALPDGGDGPRQTAASLVHCALCTLTADHLGLPPVAAQAGLRLHADEGPLPAGASPSRALPAAGIAQPRGPPAGA